MDLIIKPERHYDAKVYFYFKDFEIRKGRILQSVRTLIKKEIICLMSSGDWVYLDDLRESRDEFKVDGLEDEDKKQPMSFKRRRKQKRWKNGTRKF